ncbi:MAG: Gfo/Idh/MocA family oxidoreductase [Candidatus Latescibacteria bacterium]|nr:Gfo/Idh/MocA family oxidoreductase [Candidatus Latescibacterota bacterium]
MKIGVVGLGNFGRLHALTLAGLAESELVALVARRQASLDALDPDLAGVPHGPRPKGWLDLDRAIAESDAEAWVVATSTASHVQVTRALLASGTPVLLEKPISEDLAEVRSLAELVAPDSANLMLGHILLFNSEFLQLQEEARNRGPVKHISCVRHRPVATMDAFPGESPFHLTMVHDLYCVLALTNRAEPVHFSAQVHRTSDGSCDLALAQLVWENGTVASFEASFLTPEGMAADGFDRMEVFGEGWMARIRPNPRPIELWDEKAHWPMALEIRADPSSPGGMLAEELRCFCRVVRGQQPIPVGATYADAVQVERWLDKLGRCAVG